MTLCEKLEELGYEIGSDEVRKIFYKNFYDLELAVCIQLTSNLTSITNYGVEFYSSFIDQDDINAMQIAFNRVLKDVKELTKWLKMKAKLTK